MAVAPCPSHTGTVTSTRTCFMMKFVDGSPAVIYWFGSILQNIQTCKNLRNLLVLSNLQIWSRKSALKGPMPLTVCRAGGAQSAARGPSSVPLKTKSFFHFFFFRSTTCLPCIIKQARNDDPIASWAWSHSQLWANKLNYYFGVFTQRKHWKYKKPRSTCGY